MRVSELELDLDTVTMHCTTDEVAATLAALLREMRLVIPMLRPDEREALRRIMSRESGALTVGEVFPHFARESEGHKTLRRLRAAQFVRPANTGRWSLDEPIEVKPFARLMWDHVGEAELFPGAAEHSALVLAAKPVDEDEVPIANGEPAGEDEVPITNGKPAADDEVPLGVSEEPVAKAEPVAEDDAAVVIGESPDKWEDDDVLDLLDYANEELRRKK